MPQVTRFGTLDQLRDACLDLPAASATFLALAEERQQQLTKPAGSLGRLEELATWFASWRGETTPEVKRARLAVFAGNHGVASRGVSAYPSQVTAQMVANFTGGGAAINQLSRRADAELCVFPLRLDQPTADIAVRPAMTDAEFLEAVNVGWSSVPEDCSLFAVGEMGIGNTTIASALCAAILGGPVETWIGPGTGVDEAGRARKADAVQTAMARLATTTPDPLSTAASLGGRELAAIMGAVLAARHLSIPVLLDGFVTCAAVLPLFAQNSDAMAHCKAAHRSSEWAHGRLLEALGLEPLLDLRMRLGEGSGAALAIGLVRSAVECHSGMATFTTAGVSTRGS